MGDSPRVLVVHTAFIGDIILALPLVQSLRQQLPGAHVTFLAIPESASILKNHPAIDSIAVYDKKGSEKGVAGILQKARNLRSDEYDIALVPHRSLRSAMIAFLSAIPRRIGFSNSAGRLLFTDTVAYEKDWHEIDRNLKLLIPLNITPAQHVLPVLYPGEEDVEIVDRAMENHFGHSPSAPIAGIAPGSVWNTKRWPMERFAELCLRLMALGFGIALIGGNADMELCKKIAQTLATKHLLNASGKLTLLQSAELIRRCTVLVSNDSAPMHMAVAVGTPVVAIFGPTIPRFGFSPLGPHDKVIEIQGLPCRPCSSHGGDKCPIKTFVCMNQIGVERLVSAVLQIAPKNETKV